MWVNVIVLIQQSGQSTVGVIKNIPPQVLAEVAIGQRLEVIVNKAAIAGELIAIKIAGEIVELRTPRTLQAGQTIQLELVLEEGKPALRLVSPAGYQEEIAAAPTIKNQQINLLTLANLKQGQQLAVEVIKVLAENRLLVQVSTANNKPSLRFDIDVNKLTQQYQVGDKLQMNIVSVKPLNIQFLPQQTTSREQLISDTIRQLLPSQFVPQQLKMLSAARQNNQLPESIHNAVQQLIKYSVDHSQLTELGSLKQAILSSGFMLESNLLNQTNTQPQDFKANLARVLRAVETIIVGMKANVDATGLNNLPSQVQAALSVNGKTPAQLLNVLLSSHRTPLTSSSLASNSLAAILSQQQAVTLAQLLTKPLTLAQHSITSKQAAAMNMTELMQLFKEVEGVHHKLQLNQLTMLKQPENSSATASWLFDLPIKDRSNLDLIQMQIDQHKQNQEEEGDNDIWNVKLRLDTQNLGPVQATVTLHNKNVKVSIRAERSESVELLSENLDLLELALSKLGVSMTHSTCYCGTVDKMTMINSDNNQVSPLSLLDVSV